LKFDEKETKRERERERVLDFWGKKNKDGKQRKRRGQRSQKAECNGEKVETRYVGREKRRPMYSTTYMA